MEKENELESIAQKIGMPSWINLLEFIRYCSNHEELPNIKQVMQVCKCKERMAYNYLGFVKALDLILK